jgi:hypothetical protein
VVRRAEFDPCWRDQPSTGQCYFSYHYEVTVSSRVDLFRTIYLLSFKIPRNGPLPTGFYYTGELKLSKQQETLFIVRSNSLFFIQYSDIPHLATNSIASFVFK